MENANQTYPLLDLSQIDMLLESGAQESVDLFNEILSLFEEESKIKLDALRSAVVEANQEAFANAAHALAGSSANIGGRNVWLRAKDMENLCREGVPEKAYPMLADLEAEFAETLQQLRLYVGRFG
jgi:HPt (histidine-containing phosphotransfer) domain-containing protein